MSGIPASLRSFLKPMPTGPAINFCLRSGWQGWPAGCSPQPRVGASISLACSSIPSLIWQFEQPVSGKKSRRWHHVENTGWNACLCRLLMLHRQSHVSFSLSALHGSICRRTTASDSRFLSCLDGSRPLFLFYQ